MSFANNFSSVSALGFGALMLIGPFYLGMFLSYYQKSTDTKSFKYSYGTLYQDINTQNKWALQYQFVFTFRRLIFCLMMVYLDQGGYRQFLLNQIMSSAILLYLILIKPFDLESQNYVEMGNEVTLIILNYQMIVFQDDNVDYKVKQYSGSVYIFFVALNLVINTSFLVYKVYKTLKVNPFKLCRLFKQQAQYNQVLDMSKIISPTHKECIIEEEEKKDEMIQSPSVKEQFEITACGSQFFSPSRAFTLAQFESTGKFDQFEQTQDVSEQYHFVQRESSQALVNSEKVSESNQNNMWNPSLKPQSSKEDKLSVIDETAQEDEVNKIIEQEHLYYISMYNDKNGQDDKRNLFAPSNLNEISGSMVYQDDDGINSSNSIILEEY